MPRAAKTITTPAELAAALGQAAPGDVVEIRSGLYDKQTKVRDRKGKRGKPIVVRMADQGRISCGKSMTPNSRMASTLRAERLRISDLNVAPTDFAFLALVNCENIVIENLNVEKSWPTILFLENCRNIVIKNCHFFDATFAIYARGNSENLLIEGNEWVQDTSAGHDLWHRIDWREAHGGEGAGERYAYFNGAFLGGKNISGRVVVRANNISDAFNGIRLKVDEDQVAGAIRNSDKNAHVHIDSNRFTRIRDNPIEMEGFAYDWHVRGNDLFDCYAWFSMDDVAGGYWYFYGNTGWFRSRPGLATDTEHTMGRVLKLSNAELTADDNGHPVYQVDRVPDRPWYVFNNSWHLRCPIIEGKNDVIPAGGGEGPDFTACLNFFNNAFIWCTPEDKWTCSPLKPVSKLAPGACRNLKIDYNITGRLDYFDRMRIDFGAETNGCVASRPIFDDPADGSFQPAIGSEAIGRGTLAGIEMAGGSSAQIRESTPGHADCGAFQSYGRIEVRALEALRDAIVEEISGTLADGRASSRPRRARSKR